MSRQESLDNVCRHRRLPPLTVGTKCEVDGRAGIIVGGNSSANLSVLFDDINHTRNCHPDYKMRIFNPWGGVQHESDDLYPPPPEADHE